MRLNPGDTGDGGIYSSPVMDLAIEPKRCDGLHPAVAWIMSRGRHVPSENILPGGLYRDYQIQSSRGAESTWRSQAIPVLLLIRARITLGRDTDWRSCVRLDCRGEIHRARNGNDVQNDAFWDWFL